METGQFYIDEDGHLIILGEYAILSPAGVLLKLQHLLEENVFLRLVREGRIEFRRR